MAVGGSNWELLSGNVQEIQVSATKAVYKVGSLVFNFLCLYSDQERSAGAT